MAKPKSFEAQLTEFKKSQNHWTLTRMDPEQRPHFEYCNCLSTDVLNLLVNNYFDNAEFW